jgi:carbamate kinase
MSRAPDLTVVALGGNALVQPGETVSLGTQFGHAQEAMRAILPLLARGDRLVITHGNGYQVGQILIRAEESFGKAYALPLEYCVAETQGELGHLLELALHNLLVEHGLSRPIVGLLTQILVDPDDPAFQLPTKPIGPVLDAEQAAELRARGCPIAHDPGRGLRRVVPSPQPLAVSDPEVIGWLLERGAIVIAAGGGGIPVARGADGKLRGVAAIVDKDHASRLLAQTLGAAELLILTGVPAVLLDFGQPTQRPVHRLTPAQARAQLAAGQFPPGSMGPKVEAAVAFVEAGGRRARITSAARLGAALRGEDGTLFEAGPA